MNNYYNELSQLSILEQEINRFATSLQNKKAGCFTHRFEALLNVLPNEFRNQVNFRNKIQDYIKKSNYEKDVKDYVLQVFLSFFEPIEIKVPNSLRNVVEKNENYNKAMIEGYNNFKNEKPKLEPEKTELSERIKKHFGFFNRNCPRKHKQILNDTDFEKLIEWTIWYFENDFKVPEISEPIKVVNTNKTFVQLAFKYLFKELHKSSPYPETLFEFYQSAFTPFSEDKKRNFEAVQNKDEVKKLMQIDY